MPTASPDTGELSANGAAQMRPFGLRAGTPALVRTVITTERSVALLVLGALVGLMLMRRGFRGVLGD